MAAVPEPWEGRHAVSYRFAGGGWGSECGGGRGSGPVVVLEPVEVRPLDPCAGALDHVQLASGGKEGRDQRKE